MKITVVPMDGTFREIKLRIRPQDLKKYIERVNVHGGYLRLEYGEVRYRRRKHKR